MFDYSYYQDDLSHSEEVESRRRAQEASFLIDVMCDNLKLVLLIQSLYNYVLVHLLDLFVVHLHM